MVIAAAWPKFDFDMMVCVVAFSYAIDGIMFPLSLSSTLPDGRPGIIPNHMALPRPSIKLCAAKFIETYSDTQFFEPYSCCEDP